MYGAKKPTVPDVTRNVGNGIKGKIHISRIVHHEKKASQNLQSME